MARRQGHRYHSPCWAIQLPCSTGRDVRGAAGHWQRGHPVEGIPRGGDTLWDDDAAGSSFPMAAAPLGQVQPPLRPPSPGSPGSASRLCHLVPSTRTGTDPASHPQGNSPAALENRLSSPWARQGCAGRTPEMPHRPRGKSHLAPGRLAARRCVRGADGGSDSARRLQVR